jgi:hypothetical protein
MGVMHPPNGHRHGQRDSSPPRSDATYLDLDELLEENKQLRELVVHLSEIVVRNVLDRK